ncbi:serine/threonine-protein kinase [Paraliomyxa miuraensis]|uniref:serine/threonine-protein kinase n=1 Tax=Paraliomyxa miuraensis TaxID=376150 RepID=UPI002258915A|nr:serine/threonine-protein kinase [Paraliomyxa miuraensis]MCX4241640.1 serine/threonine protein kinase [Paraliomyxa miuraensis]
MPPCLGRPADLPPRVGPYRVHGRLGAGGVGVVYEAEDEALGRRVAVKVLADRSPASQARFRREARAMGRLNHPNVVSVYDVGEAEGQGYIAMELVRGRTLTEWLRDAPAWSEVLAVLRQAGQGLVAAHEAGLAHRDFKPDNVLVGDDGRVRVLDFGLAKHHAELQSGRFDRAALARELADGRITQTGSLMGTPAYMAPEQFRGQGDVRSDQFGFCVVVYEALYGRLPFAGDTAEELFEATSRGRLRPWPPSTGGFDVPMGVRAVLRRGLSADTDDRFASMSALLQALDDVVARGDAEPKRRHRTKGTRSWRWRIVGVGAGILLAALSSALQPPRPSESRAEPVQASATTPLSERPVEPETVQHEAKRGTVHARAAHVPASYLRARTRRPAQS